MEPDVPVCVLEKRQVTLNGFYPCALQFNIYALKDPDKTHPRMPKTKTKQKQNATLLMGYSK